MTGPSLQGQDSFLELLLAQDWIQHSYYVSDLTGAGTFRCWYGVIMASRVPIREFRRLDFKSQFVAHVNTPPGTEEIAVATSHLESPIGGDSERLRVEQLKMALSYFRDTGVHTGVFTGDFNVTNEAELAAAWRSAGWTDLNDGATTWFAKTRHAGWRPDRILIQSQTYACSSKGSVAEVHGTRPSGVRVPGSGGEVVQTPSDHFALWAVLSRTGGAPKPKPCNAPATPAQESHKWSLQKSRIAVALDSPLILREYANVTEAVELLNITTHFPWAYDECYVYSDKKGKWYQLWRHKGHWGLQYSREACVVDPQLVLDRTTVVTAAVDMLNAGAVAWQHNICYVYSDFKREWYQLWA